MFNHRPAAAQRHSRPVWAVGAAAAAATVGAASSSPILWGMAAGAAVGTVLLAIRLPLLLCVAAALPWVERLPLLLELNVGPLIRADAAAAAIVAVRVLERFARGQRIERLHGIFVAFTAVALTSSLAQGASPVRALLGWFLFVQPLIILLAVPWFVRDPGFAGDFRRSATMTLVAISSLQLVMMLIQMGQAIEHDNLKGSLIAAGAGHHVAPSAFVVAALVFLARRRYRVLGVLWLALGVALSQVGDSKQVLFAIPVVIATLLLGLHARLSRRIVTGGFVVLLGSLFAVLFGPGLIHGNYALQWVDVTLAGGGKTQVAAYLIDRGLDDPTTALFGTGAGSTVTRLALLTEDPTAGGTLTQHPEHVAINQLVALGSPYLGLSSFFAPTSSLMGLAGDYGLLGLSMYVAAWLSLGRLMQHNDARRSFRGLLVFAFTLGVVFDWLEQPPFMCAVALGVTILAVSTDEEPVAGAGGRDGRHLGLGVGAQPQGLAQHGVESRGREALGRL